VLSVLPLDLLLYFFLFDVISGIVCGFDAIMVIWKLGDIPNASSEYCVVTYAL